MVHRGFGGKVNIVFSALIGWWCARVLGKDSQARNHIG